MPLSAAERELLAAPPRIGPRGYFEQLALVGGAPAGEVLQKLLASPDAGIRAAAAKTFSHGIFGEPAVRALGASLTDAAPQVRRSATRALAMQANWRSQAAQDALTAFLAADPAKAVDPADRVSAADAVVEAARFQIKGVQQDAGLFQALVAMLEDKNEEIRTIAGNALMPIRDPEFRGDLGRPERKAPDGGWPAWLSEVSKRAAGYRKNYAECASPSGRAAELLCQGDSHLDSDPAKAFQLTRQAAELGHHPAEAMLGIMYVVGKGVEQNNPEGVKWLAKAADAGDTLAATNAWMIYMGSPGFPKDAALADRYLKLSRGGVSAGVFMRADR